MNFDPGFDITPLSEPLGFRYGKDVFGPEVENRSLEAIRKSLRDPSAKGPEIVYSIAMDVGKNTDRDKMLELNLLYGAVTYSKGRIGTEPVRSQGHIHAISPSCGSSTCEVYEIWDGKAYIYMQENAEDDPGRCFAVFAGPGDVVIVPPGWAHCTIVGDVTRNMSFGAWCVRDYGFDYTGVRAHKGVAWFPEVDITGKISFVHNEEYIRGHECIIKTPREYQEFHLEKGKPIYTQFEEDPERFLFVSRPDSVNWDHFVP